MFRFLFAFLCFPLCLSSQIKFSVYAGSNTNSVYQSNHAPLKLYPRIYATIGGEAGYQLKEHWSVALAAAYTTRGYGDATYASPAVTTNPSAPPSTVDFRFLYVDCLPKVYYDITPHFRLAGGLYVAYRSQADLKTADSSDWRTVPFPEVFSSWDFGLHTGFSMRYRRLYFFANYNLGLNPIASFKYTDENGKTIGNYKLYNRAFQLGLGYIFKTPRIKPVE